MRFKFVVPGAVAALAFAAPALADAPEVYDKCESNVNGIGSQFYARSCADTSSQTNYSATYAAIGNGYASASNSAQGGATYTVSATDGGWTNTSSGQAGNIYSYGSSSLLDGALHASVTNGGGSPSINQGFSNVRISDVVTFNNTSGDVVYLTLGYTFDGEYIGAGGSNFDYATIALALGSMGSNYITFADSGQTVAGLGQTIAWADGTFDTQWYNAGTADDFTISSFGTPGDGTFGGGIMTTIAIPVGISELGFAFTLDLSCRVAGSTCDFGNTGTFSFDALPDGLSYTSESGVLFSGLTTTSGVPEPASWATMIAGFALMGGAMRRRQRVKLAFVV